MNDEPTNESGNGYPLPPPDPTERADSFWGPSEPGDGAAPAASDARAAHRRRSPKTWIAAGVGTAAIAVAAVAGINVASSNATTVGNNSGRSGGPGVFGGPGPQGNGSQGNGSLGNGSTNGPANGFPGGPGFDPNGDGDGDHGGRGGAGTIQSINGSSFTITTRNGQTTTVTTTADTSVTRTSRGAVGDIKAGDHVIVDASGSGSTLTAERVVDVGTATLDGPGLFPGAGPLRGDDTGSGYGDARGDGDHQFAAGTVQSVNGSTVTITDQQGDTLTVSTSSGTEISVEQAASVSDLATGEQVMVRGQRTSDGTIAAADIHITA